MEGENGENEVTGSVKGARRVLTYLLLAALLAAAALMMFYDRVEDCVSVLRSGSRSDSCVLAAVSDSGDIYVLGRDDGGYYLVCGDQSGNRQSRYRLADGLLPENCRTAALYPDGDSVCYLAVYELDEAGNAIDLQLYRISDQGKTAELFLRQSCQGETVPEQMNSVRVTGFSKTGGVVSFVLLTEDCATVYSVNGDTGLLEGTSQEGKGVQAALALSDGGLLLGSGDTVSLAGAGSAYTGEGACFSAFRQSGTGVYALDVAGLAVSYGDVNSLDKFYSVLSLEKNDYDLNSCTSLALTPDGAVVLLMEGNTLLLDQGSSVEDLSDMLHQSRLTCGLFLAGLALAVLALAFVLWYAVCRWRGHQLPLILRWGVLLVAVAALCVSALLRWSVRPNGQAEAAQDAQTMTGSVVALTLERYEMDDERLPAVLAHSMAAGGSAYTDTLVSVYEAEGNAAWHLTADNISTPAGSSALLTADFDRTAAAQAKRTGQAVDTVWRDGQTRYCTYYYQDGALLVVSVGGGQLLDAAAEEYQTLAAELWAIVALLLALALAVLTWLSICLRRVTKGVEALAGGQTDVRIPLHTGDEIEGLSIALNGLADTMAEAQDRQNRLSRAYLRFVPERVLALLGKQTLDDVDKQTFVSRKMSAITVWFTFPPSVYERSGRELFDNLNEVIECTAPIVAQKGGTVFNFAYDGYDAVFDGSPAEAVSTAVAVQQKILDMNRERKLAGKPQITLRIALDEGNMMLGVVGDENQMEPTAISSSFTVARRLISLCGELDANILCTEPVAAAAQGYGSRYMGKYADGGDEIRTYEIYDGDPYEVRRGKSLTGKRFSEGVYLLYSREFSAAKRVFLELVHRNTGDGGARYYLYLADELEKHPERELNLNRRGDSHFI